MPASREAIAATNAYREAVLRLRERAALMAAAAWRHVNLEDLDGSYAVWATLLVSITEATKRQGVTLSDAYLAAFVAHETGRAPRFQNLDPEPYLSTEDGRPLTQALATPLLTVKSTIGAGQPQHALQYGLARATRIVAEEAMHAPRRALGDAMQAEDRVTGYRRVIGSRPCGSCLALASEAVLPPDESLKRHGHCRCTAEPVLRGVREAFRRPTGREVFDALTVEEQAHLFHGRGGAEKADLVRTGAVPFDALVHREPMEVTPDQYTETPMRVLRERASAETVEDHPH